MSLYGGDWSVLYRTVRSVAPEAFTEEGFLAGVWGESWHAVGTPRQMYSPNDGTPLALSLDLDRGTAQVAVKAAAAEGAGWAALPLEERCERVRAAVNLLRVHRDTLALLLVWEIGKPLTQSRTSVDRMLEGVEWYLAESESRNLSKVGA